MKNRRWSTGGRLHFLLIFCGSLLFFFDPQVKALDATWNLDANGNWNNGANWSGGSFPNGNNDTATFGNVITADRTVTLGQNITLRNITFNDNNTYTLTGNQLNLRSTFTQLGSGSVSINSTLNLARDVTFTGSGTGTVTINGQIIGSNDLIQNGLSRLILNNQNLFSGTTTIQNGTLELASQGSLGFTSSVNINSGGTLLFSGSTAIDRVSNLAQINLSGGTINLNNTIETLGSLTLTANSTIDLQIGGGSGILTFAGGSYSGGSITINNWSGTSGGGTDDRIFFTTDPGANFLANVHFTGFGQGAVRLGTGEIVPVPEPTTIFAGLFLLALLSYRWIEKSKRTAIA